MSDSVRLAFREGDKPVSGRGFKLISKIGSGGFGQVWRSTGDGGGPNVALKIVPLVGATENRELRGLARLAEVRHANLVPVTAAYVIDHAGRHIDNVDEWNSDRASALIVVMTLCDKSLDKRREEEPLGIPLEELLHLMAGTARGLDYLHKPNLDGRGKQIIVHCDVKPQNILITGGEPQICDFGLARVYDADRTTRTAQIGTVAYMSPEVLLESKAATPASDQYALAISYVELRTGRLPFQVAAERIADGTPDGTLNLDNVDKADVPTGPITEGIPGATINTLPAGSGRVFSPMHVMGAMYNNSYDLSGLDDAERNVIQRAIARNPAERYASCLEMVEALIAASAKAKESPLIPSIDQHRRNWLKSTLVTSTAIVLSVAVIAVVDQVGNFGGRQYLAGKLSPSEGFLEQYPPGTAPARIQADWLAHIRNIWSADPQTPDAKGALKECDALLEQFSDSAEARLIKARALVQQQKFTLADEALEAGMESDLPEEQHYLYFALTTIVLGEDATGDVSLDQICDRLIELDKNHISEDVDPFAKPTESETDWLKSLRRKTVNSLRDRIDDQIESRRIDLVRKDLQAAGDLTRDEDQLGQFLYPQVYVDLSDPEAANEPLVDAFAKAQQLLGPDAARELELDEAERLAVTMGMLGEKDSPDVNPALLDHTIHFLRAAWSRYPHGDVLPKQFGKSLTRRTELRIADPALPTEDELSQLQKDWTRATDARVPIPVVDAWRAECLVALGKVEDPDDLRVGDPVSDDAALAAYGAYVRALVYNASSGRQPDKILEALDEAFNTTEAKQEILGKQDRRPTAARMILDATAQQLPFANNKPATEAYLWGNPFMPSADAELHSRLLTLADADISDEQRRALEIGLMLAALHHKPPESDFPPELELAWSHASKLARLPDAQLGADTLPVLASCVRTQVGRWAELGTGKPADDQIAIGACTRILGMFEDGTPGLDNVDAVTFYAKFLAPVLAIADKHADGMSETTEDAVDPVVLEEFYASVGRFIWTRKHASWSFADTSGGAPEEVARLFDLAIKFHGSRSEGSANNEAAEYHLKCGNARLDMRPPELAKADQHAKDALKFSPDSHGANGLLSNIHLTRSRQQSTRAERYQYLSDAIEVGIQAVENSPQDDPELVSWLIQLGTAYVERANFTRDPEFQEQKTDLEEAVKYARQAAGLKSAYPDYPYLIMGNAYENLAWLVEADVEDNYEKAITSFWTAAGKQNLTNAQALRSIGRCYYKVVVASHLDPSQWTFEDLDRLSAEEMLALAGKHLEKATLEDPSLHDAFFYLGRVRLAQKDNVGADENFLRAKDVAAAEAAYPSARNYALQWAMMGGAVDPTGLETQKRIDVLNNAAGPGAEDLHASARLLEIQSLETAQEFDEAIDMIGKELPDDPSEMNSGHASLLQQRAKYRYTQLEVPDNWDWEKARLALSDAELGGDLAYTRPGLSQAFSLASKIRGAMLFRAADPGRPADFEGKEVPEFSLAIAEIRQAVELVPRLEAPDAALRRYMGAILVFRKGKFIQDEQRELPPEEAQTFVAELDHGIQWVDDFLKIPNTDQQQQTDCATLKTQFTKLRQLHSQPAPESE